jgi:hypothetical protein
MRRSWLIFSVLVTGCSSAGPYGYSRVYAPLDEEETALEGARELDPVMVQRMPDDWRKAKISVFGVVKSRKDAPNGGAYLTLGMRTVAARNLCDDANESSCRVTVSAREHAVVHAVATLRGGDDLGKTAILPGSLVRVVGHVSDDVDPADGALVIRGDYYRHWPRGEYVTMADSDHMKR